MSSAHTVSCLCRFERLDRGASRNSSSVHVPSSAILIELRQRQIIAQGLKAAKQDRVGDERVPERGQSSSRDGDRMAYGGVDFEAVDVMYVGCALSTRACRCTIDPSS
jgi:hypothetical protein